MGKSKILLGLVLVLLVGFLGFIVGALLGAQAIPPNSGLAGAGIVVGYGVMGLVIGIALAIVLAKILDYTRLRKTVMLVSLMALVPTGFIVYRIATKPAMRANPDSPQSPYQKPYTVRLQVLAEEDVPHAFLVRMHEVKLEQDGALRRISFTMASNPVQICRGEMQPLEAVDVAAAMQRVAGMVGGSMRGCTHDTLGAPLYRLSWELSGVAKQMARGDLVITTDCLTREQSLPALLDLLRRIHTRLAPNLDCQMESEESLAFSGLWVSNAWAAAPVARAAQLMIGLGMVKPRLASGQPLFFYATGALNLRHPQPIDSVTFAHNAHHLDIKTAPPWLVPDDMKLDYDLLFFRAVTLRQNWIEIVVNRETGRTAWVDRSAVAFQPWPDFLLNVASVAALDLQANPLRVKPLDHASRSVVDPEIPLRPLAVRDQWLLASASPPGQAPKSVGWLRWRNDGQLLISYSLLE